MGSALKKIAMLFPAIRQIQEDRERLRGENERLLNSKGVMLAEMTRALTVEKSAKKGEKDANGDLSFIREEWTDMKAKLEAQVARLKEELGAKKTEAIALQARVDELDKSIERLTSELYIRQIEVERNAKIQIKRGVDAPSELHLDVSSPAPAIKKKVMEPSLSHAPVKA